MKYYSEYLVKRMVTLDWLKVMEKNHPDEIINVRLCCDCPFFSQDHPTIDTDGDFGYCTYKTDFAVLDDEPIHWYFTSKNSFCDENTIRSEE